jgi:hypothetical protein
MLLCRQTCRWTAAKVDGIRMGINPGKLPMLTSSTFVLVADGERAMVISALVSMMPKAWSEVVA